MELGILTAQLAYINQRMGEEEAAMKAYAQLFSFKAELDPAVAAIAGNNMVALRGTRDLFDSWKKCRANIASEAQLKKLTKRQRCATLLKVPAAAFPPLPCLSLLLTLLVSLPVARAAWDTRLRAWAAARTVEARRGRSDLSGSFMVRPSALPSRRIAPPVSHHLGSPSTSTLRCSPSI